MVAVTICNDFGAKENKTLNIFHEVMGLDDMISVFGMLSFKPAFSPSSFTFTKGLFSSLYTRVTCSLSVHLSMNILFAFICWLL